MEVHAEEWQVMYLDEGYDEDLAWSEEEYGDDLDEGVELASLSEALREVLRDDLSEASPEELEDALEGLMETMSPAESFSFTKALQQIRKGAGQVLTNPTVGAVLRTGLPLAGRAVGTVFGGPAGTAVGSGLGTALVNALPGAARATPAQPAAPGVAPAVPVSAVAGGSAAAAQGLALTQQPDVLKALLSLSLGQAGKPSVNGVPVPQVMNMLSDVFGRAAAHADELMYSSPEAFEGEDAGEEVGAPDPQSLYVALMDADSYELAEAATGGVP